MVTGNACLNISSYTIFDHLKSAFCNCSFNCSLIKTYIQPTMIKSTIISFLSHLTLTFFKIHCMYCLKSQMFRRKNKFAASVATACLVVGCTKYWQLSSDHFVCFSIKGFQFAMLTWFVHYWLLPRSKHPLVSKVRRGGRRGKRGGGDA